jgi:hypothetical protein
MLLCKFFLILKGRTHNNFITFRAHPKQAQRLRNCSPTMLCEFCKKVKPPHLRKSAERAHSCLIRHHANFADLIQSARRGCELCQLFEPFVEYGRKRRERWPDGAESDDGCSVDSASFHKDPFEDFDDSKNITIQFSEDLWYEDAGDRYRILNMRGDDKNDAYIKKIDQILEKEEDEDKKAGLSLKYKSNAKTSETVQWLIHGMHEPSGPEQIWIRGWSYYDDGDEGQAGTGTVLTLSAGSLDEDPCYDEGGEYCVGDGLHLPNPVALLMELPSLWKWKHFKLRKPREGQLEALEPVFEFYQNRGMALLFSHFHFTISFG